MGPMIFPAYRYRATLVKVLDGDTVRLDVDLGFHATIRVDIRIRGIDTPERGEPGWAEAGGFTLRMLQEATAITVETFRDRQSFARWIGDIYVDGTSLAELIDGNLQLPEAT